MNRPPLISIITVCYNSEAHIADALRSVDTQTWPNLEHLVIDGASRDATLAVVAQHPRPWRHVVSERDRGIYDAMNKGIALARGELIGFLNSDDFYPTPRVLERVAEVFADESIEGCYGDLCYVRQNDTSSIVRYWRSSPFEPGLFSSGWCPPHPTLFIRRATYARLGGFDLRYPIAADMELMARYLEVNRIRTVYLPEVLVHMRMGGTTNRSLRNILQQNREIWQALEQHRLSPSFLSFLGGKLVSRCRQFLSRPTA